MAGTLSVTARDVLDRVGGKGNVADLMHCMTRLRFSVRDPQKVDRPGLERIDGVISVIDSGGQIQVVMPDRVNAVYDELSHVVETDEAVGGPKKQGGWFGRAVDLISAIFTPIIPAMAGAGVLKGLLILATTLNWLSPTSGEYLILWGVADALFYFLPVLLAITSARRFKANAFVAATIGGALIYPSLITALSGDAPLTFFGIAIQDASYAYSVIPIVVAVWMQSLLERGLNKVVPQPIRLFTVPLLCFVLVTPATFLIFGPWGTTVAGWLASGLMALYSASPWLAGLIIAGAWQIVVLFGLHWGSVPIIINNISQYGSDWLLPFTGPAVFGQAGAAAAVAIKSKQRKTKSVAGAATVSALFGITEPALYGTTLRLKKPFIAGSIGAAAGGAIAGAAGAQAITLVPASVASLPAFIGPGFVGYLIGNGVALVVGLVLTWILGFDDADPDVKAAGDLVVSATLDTRDEVLLAPATGTVIPLSDVPDKAFAAGTLGRGVAIKASVGAVYAPAAGQVVSLPSSGHAVGLRTEKGAEVLIHIGIDTVKLGPGPFSSQVQQGQVVAAGDLLVRFNQEAIRKAGYDDTVIVVVTNTAGYDQVQPTTNQSVGLHDPVLTVVG